MSSTVGAVITIGTLLTWVIAAIMYHPCKPSMKRLQPKIFVYALSLLLIVIGIWLRFTIRLPIEPYIWGYQLLFDLAPNMITAGITVLGIEQLTRWWQREEEREKEKLTILARMCSPDPGVALEAVRLVTHNRWHRDTSLQGKDLGKLRISNKSLKDGKHLSLRWANLRGCRLAWSEMNNTSLNFIDLRDAVLDHAQLNGADLRSAKLQHARLQYVKMDSNTQLVDANFSGADFSWAQLDNVSFHDATICGVNFSNASMATCNLNGAKYDDATVWPRNGKPSLDGAKKGRYDKLTDKWIPESGS